MLILMFHLILLSGAIRRSVSDARTTSTIKPSTYMAEVKQATRLIGQKSDMGCRMHRGSVFFYKSNITMYLEFSVDYNLIKQDRFITRTLKNSFFKYVSYRFQRKN
jgi:hypothetical protein